MENGPCLPDITAIIRLKFKMPSNETRKPNLWEQAQMLGRIVSKLISEAFTAPILHQPEDIEMGGVSPHSSAPRSSRTSTSSKPPWVDRRNFEAIEAIEDGAFVKLLLQHLDPDNKLDPNDCDVVERAHGTYNYCAILSVANDDARYVIKVPAIGTAAVWQAGDAYNLRNEVYTMKYISCNTNVPIPKIYGWDDSLDNAIGAPYTLMHAVLGMPAHYLWDDKNDLHNPSMKVDTARRNFLKNLANTMAELRHLAFDKIGALHFTQDPEEQDAIPPTVSHYFSANSDGTLSQIDAHSSSEEYFQAKKDAFGEALTKDKPDGTLEDFEYGIQAFYDFVFQAYPFTPQDRAEPETFVLAHNDLDLQNIYVDSAGHIVGIIDWDNTRTVPRCIGYAALPLFLRKDWEDPGYDFEEHLPTWTLDEYRGFYDECMCDATAFADGKFTRKSKFYAAAAMAMEGCNEDWSDFLQRMFKEIAPLREIDMMQFLTRLGRDGGWPDAERMLKREIGALFNP
ncbi:hypothetical protein BDV95DRAFT_624282 [Massariosphaeria phaeospora]|uniref:Aminoglycoside phosphotransferase domain-containing protein n=1 Tax=Massariosphaeria phaeospora TaxID=100035 RepID=A0A7C8M087_9PLEO|nr:hypothetical protein BDV95DRAFT_624282 [Massariosphaeria phaeospora]